jgi:hypothetical protein
MTQTCTGLPSSTLCEKVKGTTGNRKKLIGDGTTHQTLSLERKPLKIGAN